MAPTTRRELRLSASFPDLNSNATHPPTSSSSASADTIRAVASNHLFSNVEQILENFEQFKRKHISQNREIIKANTLAHMKIRELETRVRTLESEKAQHALVTVGLNARLNILEYSLACVKVGWDAMGRGLDLSSVNVLDASLGNPPPQEALGISMRLAPPEPHLRPANHISLDPNAMPAGVVKPVARAPDGHLMDLIEVEESSQPDASHPFYPSIPSFSSNPRAWKRQPTPLVLSQFRQDAGANDQDLEQLQGAVSVFDVDGAPSPLGSPGLPMDLEDVLAVASRNGFTAEWHPNPQQPMETDDPVALLGSDSIIGPEEPRILRRSGRRSSRRQSGLLSPSLLEEDNLSNTEADSAIPMNLDSNSAETTETVAMVDAGQAIGQERNANGNDNGYGDEQGMVEDEYDTTMTLSPSLLDQRAFTDPARTTNNALREVMNGVNPRQSRDAQVELVKPTPRKPRRPKMEPESHAQKTPVEDFSVQEAVTPSSRKRKVPALESEELPPIPLPPASPTPTALLFSPNTSSESAAVSSGADADNSLEIGRSRRARKSVNYALPKLNTKLRKPDPVDLVPASSGSVETSSSKNNTPASSRMVGSTGNLSDIRKLHEASASRKSRGKAELLHIHSLDPSSTSKLGKRSGSGPDEDGNGEGGNASLADLFEANPPKPRTKRIETPHLALQGLKANENVVDAPASTFWKKTEAATDTSDDESRAMSASDLGEIAELEGAMADMSTADKLEPNGRPSSKMMTPSESTTSLQSTSSMDSVSSNGTRRPSLRRRSTVLPTRIRVSTGSSSASTPNLRTSPNLDTVGSCSSVVVPKQRRGTTSDSTDSSVTASNETNSLHHPAISKSLGDLPKKVHPPVHPSSTTITISARLAANMRPKERPNSVGSGASTWSSSSATAKVSSPPLGTMSLGRASGMSISSSSSAVQRGGSSHRVALTHNQPRPTSVTPRLGTKGLLSSSPANRSSPALSSTKSLPHPSAIGNLNSRR